MVDEDIFVPNLGSLKRNTTTRSSPEVVVTRVAIPP